MIGFACDEKVLSPFNLYIIAIILGIIACLSFILLKQFWLLMCFGIIYGICSGNFFYFNLNRDILSNFWLFSKAGLNALIVPCIKMITSSDQFNNAYGIIFFFTGVGSLIGPYVTGIYVSSV